MYSSLKDEELIKALSTKNREYAELCLITRYRRNAFFVAQKFYAGHKNCGITLDDFYSVALSAIIIAARRFKPNKGMNFLAFFKKVAENALVSYFTDNSYFGKAKMFIGPISLDDSFDDEGISYSESFGDIDAAIESNISEKELEDSFAIISKKLSEKEIAIYRLYQQGYRFKEIGKILNIPQSTVFRAYTNILKKISRNYLK